MSEITRETKKRSYNSLNINNRYNQILERLDKPKTAKEIAIELFKEKIISSPERNYTAPRLSELEEMGIVRSFSKKKCEYTGKYVAVYERIDLIGR